MKPNEINTLIATACGWKNIHPLNKWKEGGPKGRTDGTIIGDVGDRKSVGLPNYAASLDAMHEAEKTLVRGEKLWHDYYRDHLPLVAGGVLCAMSATAAQRAEAFLRVKGLWREGK